MAKKPVTLFVDANVLADLETVACGTHHLDGKKYGALALSRLSQLKPEFALEALTSIPREYFKRGPGRPSSAPGSSVRHEESTV